MSSLSFSVMLLLNYFSPAEVQGVRLEAVQAHLRGEPDLALKMFESLIEHGAADSDVYYNAGTLHLSKKQLGRAVLYLERAKQLEGASADIEAQLAMARAQQSDRLPSVASFREWTRRLVSLMNPHVASWGLLVFLSVAVLIRLVFRSIGRAPSRWYKIALLGVVLFGSIVGGQALFFQRFRQGVTMASEVPICELPQNPSKVLWVVHEGLRVELLGQESGFWRVRLPDGREGWAQREGIAEI